MIRTKPFKVKTNEVNKIEYSSDHPGSIKSPMVGTAYSSPEPGKEPFIKLDDQIKIGQPLINNRSYESYEHYQFRKKWKGHIYWF